jgi:hypothetical protein
VPGEPPLFLERALGSREGLEPLVRDRLAALDREAVPPRRQPPLRAFERGEPLAQVVREALVELVLVEIRGEVRGLLEPGLLAVVLVAAMAECVLELPSLGGKELTGSCDVHQAAS